MLRCASALVVATYTKSTPHSSGFARLASETFYEAIKYNNPYNNVIPKIMMRKIFYTILILLLVTSCANAPSQNGKGSHSFRDVPPEWGKINWGKTPNDVIRDPIKDEHLIWVGLVRNVSVTNKGDKIEIEWFCEHLAFTELGPAAISTRPIKTHKGQGYFVFSIIVSEMSMAQAMKFKKEHTSSPHYVLAGGTLDSLVEREGKKIPFLYVLRSGWGPDLAKIIE